jgi:hypothetical protein
MANFLGKSWFWPVRILTTTFGICSIAWTFFSLPVFQAEAPLTSSAQYLLSGERFNAEQLSELSRRVEATPVKLLRSNALNSIVIIRLRLIENERTTGNNEAFTPHFADVESAVTAALVEDPGNSFLWLAQYWLQSSSSRAADRSLKFLRMSYFSGPNEAWIAVRRNPLALGIFSLLPSELAERVLSEFAGLVRSGLYLDAANIVAGSDWAVRKKLLSRLTQFEETDRRRFAKVLESKNLDGASVLGVDERPSRPF